MFLCDKAEIDAVSRVITSKKIFRYQGADVETECSKFEKEFSQYLNIPYTLFLSSGTNALVTALFVNGIGPGVEVLVPSYTFFATISAIIEVGAIPVIININEALLMDLDEAKKKITNKTKAIIAVHMDGESCDMDLICFFAKENNLLLIEDVAQAIGGSFKGKKLGTFGNAGCFSFNVDKIISCGEGGAVVINNGENYQKALMYHDTCNQFGPSCKDLYTIESFSGKSMRASEIQGAMIRVQLTKLEEIIALLKVRKKLLKERLNALEIEILDSSDDQGSCSTTMRVKLKDPSALKEFVVQLNSLGLKSIPALMRPGHNVWNWLPLLKKYGNYNRNQFLQTIDYLSSTVIIFMSLEECEDEWKAKLMGLKT